MIEQEDCEELVSIAIAKKDARPLGKGQGVQQDGYAIRVLANASQARGHSKDSI